MSLKGKHALITGSSRGIGRGIALKLAEAGATIGIHYYRNEAAAKETLRLIKQRGAHGEIFQADVTKPDQIERLFKEVRSRFPSLDIFVSNARPEAFHFFYPPTDITLEQMDAAFDSQVKGFVIGAREAGKMMNEGVRIIAITYGTGSRTGGLLPWVAMGSAKAAMESLVRYFAVAFMKRGITVNAISPAWTEDSVLNSLPESVQKLIRDWHQQGWTPMRRLGTPADVGDVVNLFCSPQANWITGQVIFADGGASLMNPEVPPEIQLG